MPNQESEVKRQKAEEAAEDRLLTRPGLAVVLRVSVTTVDRMVVSGDLLCVRLRGRVRFYLPDVIEALRRGSRKSGRRADTNLTNCREGGQPQMHTDGHGFSGAKAEGGAA